VPTEILLFFLISTGVTLMMMGGIWAVIWMFIVFFTEKEQKGK
jgi:hypothetical protein